MEEEFDAADLEALEAAIQQTGLDESDKQALAQAVEAVTAAPTAAASAPDWEEMPVLVPVDLFDVAVGHENAKTLFLDAIRAEKPVHVLLVSGPGTGKSVLLDELERLPNSEYRLGGGFRRAGLTAFLLERPQLRYLILDELEKAEREDLATLLTLMEKGVVVPRLTSKPGGGLAQGAGLKPEKREIRVFAACNSDANLPAELRDRFVREYLPAYDQATFTQVAQSVLLKRESCDPALAKQIAEGLAQAGSRSVRDSVQVARLARGDQTQVPRLIQQMTRTPIQPPPAAA